MNILTSLYLAALFVAFVPGILVTLPKGGSKYTVLAVHAALFALAWHLTHKMVLRLSYQGFQNATEYNANGNPITYANANNAVNNSMNNAGNSVNAEAFKEKK